MTMFGDVNGDVCDGHGEGKIAVDSVCGMQLVVYVCYKMNSNV